MAALYHNLPVDDAARFDEGVAEGMVVGKFMHDVGIAIFNLSGGHAEAGRQPAGRLQGARPPGQRAGKAVEGASTGFGSGTTRIPTT